jgi:tetratricopeptide (TPR) repeat protein
MMLRDKDPYPGLRSFRRDESYLFFGRDECVDLLIERLAATRFLAVLGSSGTGKSSLVKTGLLSGLEMGLLSGASSRWWIVDFQPGQPDRSPMHNLARRLLEVSNENRTAGDVNQLNCQLKEDGPRGLINWCSEGRLPKGTNLLLLVDQFEELFRYQDYAGSEDAEEFVALLLESAHPKGIGSPRMADYPIYVTITMRSEYLGACSLIQGLPEAINDGTFLTPRMTRNQCREAIVGPAKVCGVEIDADLVNRILNDLANFAPWDDSGTSDRLSRNVVSNQFTRLARRADQLPVMQYALNQMWGQARKIAGPAGGAIRLTLDVYKEIGGVRGAINRHADRIFNNLAPEQKSVTQAIFRALISGKTLADAVRRPIAFGELVAICGGDENADRKNEVREIVNMLRAPDCNFLLPEIDRQKSLDAMTLIDISHESLIREWKKLSDWLVEEAAAAEQWRRLEDRFNLGEPLRDKELANLAGWRDEFKPDAAWAKRYGGDYTAVIEFLDESLRAEKASRLIRRSFVAGVIALLLMGLSGTSYLWQAANANREKADYLYAIAGAADSFIDALGPNLEPNQFAKVTRAILRARDARAKLGAIDPDNIELLGTHAQSLERFAQFFRTNGSYELALSIATEANELFRRRLFKSDSENMDWQGYLALNLNMIGDLRWRLSDADFAGTRKSFEEALSIDRELARSEPENEDHPRQMAIDLVKIGDLQLRDTDTAGALKSYEEARDIRHKLAELYPILPVYQKEVSSTLVKIGDFKLQSNDKGAALEAYQEGLKIDQQIVKSSFDFDSAAAFDNISIDLVRIAALQDQLGNQAASLMSYGQSLDLDNTSVKTDEGIQRQIALHGRIAMTSTAMGDLQLRSSDTTGATASYKTAFEAGLQARQDALIAFKALPGKPTWDVYANAIGRLVWYAVLSGQREEANQSADELKSNSEGGVAINRAHAYVLNGRYDEAEAIYRIWKDKPKTSDNTKTYADDIRDDFEKFRKLGIATSDVDRVSKEIGL